MNFMTHQFISLFSWSFIWKDKYVGFYELIIYWLHVNWFSRSIVIKCLVKFSIEINKIYFILIRNFRPEQRPFWLYQPRGFQRKTTWQCNWGFWLFGDVIGLQCWLSWWQQVKGTLLGMPVRKKTIQTAMERKAFKVQKTFTNVRYWIMLRTVFLKLL